MLVKVSVEVGGVLVLVFWRGVWAWRMCRGRVFGCVCVCVTVVGGRWRRSFTAKLQLELAFNPGDRPR